MAKLSTAQIADKGKQIVREHPTGIRVGVIVKEIEAGNPETPINTIWTVVSSLPTYYFPDEIERPSRGVLIPRNEPGEVPVAPDSITKPAHGTQITEDAFYEPLARWLVDDANEATIAFALGGGGLRGKWGTPDVIGAYKPLPSNRIKFPHEIVAAEVKINPSEGITAFGQAAAYRLFANKSYIAMPRSTGEEDISRLRSLCMIFGIGLIDFDLDLERSEFRMITPAQRFQPDMFYVNEFADRLHDHRLDLFNELFG